MWKSAAYGTKKTTTTTSEQVPISTYVYKIVEHLKYYRKSKGGDLARYVGLNRIDDVKGLMSEITKKDNIDYDQSTDTFSYRAKFSAIKDKKSLLSNLENEGIFSLKDIRDCYVGIEKDVHSLMISGDIIMIGKEFGSKEDDRVIYPRGNPCLVKISGKVNLKKYSREMKTELKDNIPSQIRRGDALIVLPNGHPHSKTMNVDDVWRWNQRVRNTHRVSFEVVNGFEKDSLARRSQYSVSSKSKRVRRHDLEHKTSDRSVLPLKNVWLGDSEEASVFRFGATNEIRKLWLDTASDIKDMTHKEMQTFLKKKGDSREAAQKTTRRYRSSSSRRKKRRIQKVTNEHLRDEMGV